MRDRPQNGYDNEDNQRVHIVVIDGLKAIKDDALQRHANESKTILAEAAQKAKSAKLAATVLFDFEGQAERMTLSLVSPDGGTTLYTLDVIGYDAAPADTAETTPAEGEENTVYEKPTHTTY